MISRPECRGSRSGSVGSGSDRVRSRLRKARNKINNMVVKSCCSGDHESTEKLLDACSHGSEEAVLERGGCHGREEGGRLRYWVNPAKAAAAARTTHTTKSGVPELLSYEELPEYMKENEYIHRYYRSEWSFTHAFLSLFRWHNETLSVWTHLVGFLVFLGLTLMHLRDVPVVADLLSGLGYWPFLGASEGNISKDSRSLYGGQSVLILGNPALSSSEYLRSTASTSQPGAAPRWPFFVFLGGSMFCLLSSSMCHLFCCHSRRLNLVLWRLDYVGIAVMIVASFFPPIYYIFQCEPHWQWVYLGSITAMGILTISTLLSPHLSSGSFRVFRAMLFSGMAFTGIIPAVHATIVNWDQPQRPITLAYESAMAMLYVTGTLFYVSRVPERWKPGFFDLTGHSHQIFHVFVVAGALAHYAAALVFLEWRDRNGCSML